MAQTNQDQVTLVNEQDKVIGAMDKVEAHRDGGKLHRASSVFLFRENDNKELELLIQKRSDKKIVGAGQWANTVCGNVLPGESYEECARRRLSFELGITDDVELKDVATFRYKAQCNQEFSENELVHIFAGWWEGDVAPNPDEVADWQHVKWQDALSLTEPEDDFEWTPWFQLFMQKVGYQISN